MDWVWAGVAIVAGFVIGSIISQAARNYLDARPGKLGQMAAPVASLAFSLALVVGLLVALSFVQPTSLEKLRDDTIDYLPRAISALIVVILGGLVGTLVSTAVRESIGRSMGRLGEQVPSIVKSVITVFAAILAASQLGIDTTIINIAVAATVFSLAAAFALIVGLGSRPVAVEIAAGRALSRLVQPGDSIAAGFGSGQIISLFPTAVEVEVDGTRRLVPNSALTGEAGMTIERSNHPESDHDENG